MFDVNTLISIGCLIALPVLLKAIYDSFKDAFDYYHRDQTTEEIDYVYMSDLLDRKKRN